MLVNNIMNMINKNIGEYNAKLVEKFGLDLDEINKLWEELSGSKAKKPRVKKSKDDDSVKSKDTSKTKSDDSSCCQYVFTKGKNAGENCTIKPKDGEYCSKHKKEKVEKEKKPADNKKSEKSEKTKFIIRKNKDLDLFWNPETKLVFKSKDEKVVIGTCQEGTLVGLTDDDIKTCEKYSLKYEMKIEEEGDEECKEEVDDEIDEEIDEEVDEEVDEEDDE